MFWSYNHTNIQMQGNLSSSDEARRNEMRVPRSIEIYSWQVEDKLGCGGRWRIRATLGRTHFLMVSGLQISWMFPAGFARPSWHWSPPCEQQSLQEGQANTRYCWGAWHPDTSDTSAGTRHTHTEISNDNYCILLYGQYSAASKHPLKGRLYKGDDQHKILQFPICKAIWNSHGLNFSVLSQTTNACKDRVHTPSQI